MLLAFACCGLILGTLSACAVHNRKQGWVKPRRNYLEDMARLKAELTAEVEIPTAVKIPAAARAERTKPVELTIQLANLHNAMASMGQPVKVSQGSSLEPALPSLSPDAELLKID